MERLGERRTSGLNTNGVRAIAMVMLILGIIGRGLLQTHILGLGSVTTEDLLLAMQTSATTMMIATISLVCQAMESCAAPLFACLLVEGFQHTSSLKHYVLRVLGLAVLTEIPYNLAMGGKVLDFSSRNPVFGVLLALGMLYLYSQYEEKNVKNVLLKMVVTAAAMVWPMMLKIDSGICLVFLVCVIWYFRNKPNYRNLGGAAGSMVCTLFSPFYMAAPMAFLVIHFYNGEKGENNRLVTYLAYPVLLLAVGLVGMLMF